MKTPIFEISEPNDLLVFETKEIAEKYIEAADLLHGKCFLVDSEGRFLPARPHPNGSIIIEPNFAEPVNQNELRTALLNFFDAIGEDRSVLVNATLQELVQKSLHHKTM